MQGKYWLFVCQEFCKTIITVDSTPCKSVSWTWFYRNIYAFQTCYMKITIFSDVILCCVKCTNILGRLTASIFKVEAWAMQEKTFSDIGFGRQGFGLWVVPCGPERGCTITAEEAGQNQWEQWQLQGLCSCIGREQLNNNIQIMKGKRCYYTVYI